jgi:hypothetical protein
MAEDDGFFGGHIVDAVLEFFAGTDGAGGESEDFFAKPPSISMVGDDEPEAGEQGDEQGFHCVYARWRGGKLGEFAEKSNARGVGTFF